MNADRELQIRFGITMENKHLVSEVQCNKLTYAKSFMLVHAFTIHPESCHWKWERTSTATDSTLLLLALFVFKNIALSIHE
jgi:hypothetical protein